MPFAFINRDDLKTALGITDTTDDTALRRAIEAATRQIDDKLDRRFHPYTATRYYTARDYDWLMVDDLLTVTTLKTLTTNSSGTRTYGNTWATTDYDLEPYDAADGREPFTAIRANPSGAYTYPTDRRGVEVVGLWGFWLETVSVGTLGAAISDTTGLTVTMTAGHSVKALHTLLIDTEQVYVASVATNTLTLDARGANGSTAATHSNGAAVVAYRYPEPIVEAAILEATRLFRRKDAPFGIVGGPEFGTERIPAMDPDWKALTERYRRRGLLVGV